MHHYSYLYDKLNRLTVASQTKGFNELISYDKMGNIISMNRNPVGASSYSYSGNRLMDISGAINGSYSYDANGNQTADSHKGIILAYNYLNLPETISKASTSETMTNTWLATGAKIRKTVGGMTREYVGGIEYNDGQIEFIQTEEGRAIPSVSSGYRYEYMLKDHLGNTRVLLEEGGTVLENSDYYPFGLQVARGQSVISPENRYKYNGKELQTELGLGQYDYGARFYDPVIGRFTGVDPLAEDAPAWSPYNAMWNNPIRFVDPDGRWAVDHIDVTKNDDGTYKVVGGQANSDKNIYVVDGGGKRTGEVVGQMLTEYSFHHEDGSAVKGTNINLSDQSGQDFFNNEIKNVGLFDYIANAKGGEPLDFKHRGMDDRNENTTVSQHHYRGMSFNGKVASARDIGNYSAGYVAGKHGFGWGASRFAFDALETKQAKGTWNTILYYPFNRVREGQPTQQAERAGHNVGYPIFKQRQAEREWKKVTNPWPIGPKY